MAKKFLVMIALSVLALAQAAPAPAKAAPAKAKTAGSATATRAAAHKKPMAKSTKPVTAARSPAAPSNTVELDTSMGKLTCTLFPKDAPKTVENFLSLANGSKEWTDPNTGKKTKRPLFDGTIFHRVIPNFMIQGGDPLGNGTGNPGYRFEDEISPELTFDRPGRLAMANSGPATNGSQFFITEVPTPWLDGHHTIFGQCDDASIEIVKNIARVASDPRNNMPLEPVKLNHVGIAGAPKATPKGVVKKPMQHKKVGVRATPAVKK